MIYMHRLHIFCASQDSCLCKNGFKSELRYRGQVFPVTFKMYVPFIVGDTKGHNRLCGHYNSKGQRVKQLCHACECPTELSRYSNANFQYRKWRKVQSIINNRETFTLRAHLNSPPPKCIPRNPYWISQHLWHFWCMPW